MYSNDFEKITLDSSIYEKQNISVPKAGMTRLWMLSSNTRPPVAFPEVSFIPSGKSISIKQLTLFGNFLTSEKKMLLLWLEPVGLSYKPADITLRISYF